MSEEVDDSRRLSSKKVWEFMLNRESLLKLKSICMWILDGYANLNFFAMS